MRAQPAADVMKLGRMKADSSALSRLRTLSLLALLGASALCGCQSSAADDSSRASLKFEMTPPISLVLDTHALIDAPSGRSLRWSAGDSPALQFELPLPPLYADMQWELGRLGWPIRVKAPQLEDPDLSQGRPCRADCAGTLTSRIDAERRALIIDVELRLSTSYNLCETRLCTTIAADGIHFDACREGCCDCVDLAYGWPCSAPVTGALIRNGDKACANPQIVPTTLQITAHAELSEQMLAAPTS